MNLAAFRGAVERCRRPTGHTQQELARELGLHPAVLSHKLHGSDGAVLRQEEVRAIVRTLAAWQAVVTRAQAIELLQLMDLGPNSFSAAEWAAAPLADLEAGTLAERPTREADRSGPPPRENLPAELTPLVGRAELVRQVADLLEGTARLVTLTGIGGVGKTRVALAVAADLARRAALPVCLVPVAAIRDPGLVPGAIAAELGVQERAGSEGGIESALIAWLRDRRLLLVLDNLEQVLSASPVIATLLRAAPGLRVLATSRMRLHLYGEHEVHVPPLRLPASGATTQEILASQAVALFVQRARAASSDFVSGPSEAPLLGAICTWLDGLPLAIELAAARTRQLPLPLLLERLTHRLDVLDHGPRDAPARHRALRATLDWSYDLLPVAQQRLFERLGVFVGGCTLEAAQAVCGETGEDVGEALWELVDAAVLEVPDTRAESLAETRFQMLETIREYALARLAASGDEHALRTRHAAHFLALVERAEAQLHGPLEAAWLPRLDREHNNCRAALAWLGRCNRWLDALHLAAGLGEFWLLRGYYTEGRARLTEILARTEALARTETARALSLRARAYVALANLAARQGDYPSRRCYHDAAVRLASEAGDRGLVVQTLGSRLPGLDIFTDDAPRAQWEDALGMARALGRLPETGSILVYLGLVLSVQGDLEGAEAHIAEGLAILRQVGDVARLAFALNLASSMVIDRGNYAYARALAEEYRPLAEALGDASGQANCLVRLAEVACWEGQLARARTLLEQALAIYREVDDRHGMVWAVAESSRVCLQQGDLERARGLAEDCTALIHQFGVEGDLVTLVIRVNGDVALAEGDVHAAAANYRDGLVRLGKRWHGEYRLALIEGLAKVAEAQGQAARALRLASAAAAERVRLGAEPSRVERTWMQQALARARQALSSAEADAAWSQGWTMPLEQAVADALRERGPLHESDDVLPEREDSPRGRAALLSGDRAD